MEEVFAPKKSLGQHWLNDAQTLADIVKAAELSSKDTVLEVGPGTGTLTANLLMQAGRVIAVEKDKELAKQLKTRLSYPGFTVQAGDILKFDLTKLPKNYKVVANIPYYLTGHLLKILAETANPPAMIVLLVQKEVARRIAARPGSLSVLAISIQLRYEPKLGRVVPAELFSPPPKVDSQVIILRRRPRPQFAGLEQKIFFRVVKAGFSARRKKLRGSLAGGLGINRAAADDLLDSAEINGELRAQALSLEQWHQLYMQYRAKSDLETLLRKTAV